MCYSQRVYATSEHSSRLVSVIVPVYNGQETICRAIDSALRQTYREHEIIVVDDGSTDSSLELLQKYRRKIRLVQQKRGGAASARNHALRMARGDYVAFLDQDDAWVPEKLELQVGILKRHRSVGLTFSNLEAINKQGDRLGFTMHGWLDPRYPPSWEDLLVRGFLIVPASVLARKGLILKVGGFDADLFVEGGYEDRDLFLRLREITDFHYLDVCLAYYCIDPAHWPRQNANLLHYARKYWNHPKVQQGRAWDKSGIRDGFAQKCLEEMGWRMRFLLKLEGNRVSKEMLDKLIGFHDSLKDLFGDSYKRVTGFDSIDMNRYELNAATSVLLYLYLCRIDLQEAYREVSSGNLFRLIDWAAGVARGDYKDGDLPILLTYSKELERLRKRQLLERFPRLLWARFVNNT